MNSGLNCQNCYQCLKCQVFKIVFVLVFVQNVKIVKINQNLAILATWPKKSKNIKIVIKSKCWSDHVSSSLRYQMSQMSQVSGVALWMSSSKVLSQWLTQWLTRSPIELFWTAKKNPKVTRNMLQLFVSVILPSYCPLLGQFWPLDQMLFDCKK